MWFFSLCCCCCSSFCCFLVLSASSTAPPVSSSAVFLHSASSTPSSASSSAVLLSFLLLLLLLLLLLCCCAFYFIYSFFCLFFTFDLVKFTQNCGPVVWRCTSVSDSIKVAEKALLGFVSAYVCQSLHVWSKHCQFTVIQDVCCYKHFSTSTFYVAVVFT